jgi:hypothetical protein
VIAQNDVPPLAPLDAATGMSYWPTAQVPSMEPLHYPASCYDNQDLSPTHRHTATDDHFQSGLPGVCGGMTYDTTSLIYAESDTPATALPAPAPHPAIAHDQTVSGHDLTQWDPMVMRSALYEVSTLPHPVGDDTGSQGSC